MECRALWPTNNRLITTMRIFGRDLHRGRLPLHVIEEKCRIHRIQIRLTTPPIRSVTNDGQLNEVELLNESKSKTYANQPRHPETLINGRISSICTESRSSIKFTYRLDCIFWLSGSPTTIFSDSQYSSSYVNGERHKL